SECCVATGDSGCEAYTAIAWGVGLSHERSYIAGAESFYSLEGNMCGTVMRGAVALPGSYAQQSTYWTQNQARVSQALRRILRAFAVTHRRRERYAGKPHVRFWAGGVR